MKRDRKGVFMVSGGLGKSCCHKFHFSDLDSMDIFKILHIHMAPSLNCHILMGQYYYPSGYGWRDSQQMVGKKKSNPGLSLLIQYTLWLITNVHPNEIPLYYSLELESKFQHSNANIICMKYFASDGPGSDSGKSSSSFRLDNLTLLYHSHLLSTNPYTDHLAFPPSHILSMCSPYTYNNSSAEWG